MKQELNTDVGALVAAIFYGVTTALMAAASGDPLIRIAVMFAGGTILFGGAVWVVTWLILRPFKRHHWTHLVAAWVLILCGAINVLGAVFVVSQT
ncbi:hypothetical protein [Synechococcus phage Ssp-JY39]|nr:hypothetical protein [Synechococcus phage Yong-M2-251]